MSHMVWRHTCTRNRISFSVRMKTISESASDFRNSRNLIRHNLMSHTIYFILMSHIMNHTYILGIETISGFLFFPIFPFWAADVSKSWGAANGHTAKKRMSHNIVRKYDVIPKGQLDKYEEVALNLMSRPRSISGSWGTFKCRAASGLNFGSRQNWKYNWSIRARNPL